MKQVLLLNKAEMTRTLIITAEHYNHVELPSDAAPLQFRDEVTCGGKLYLVTKRRYDVETNTMFIETRQR